VLIFFISFFFFLVSNYFQADIDNLDNLDDAHLDDANLDDELVTPDQLETPNDRSTRPQ
jgi:hypothetical protein